MMTSTVDLLWERQKEAQETLEAAQAAEHSFPGPAAETAVDQAQATLRAIKRERQTLLALDSLKRSRGEV